MTGRSSWRRRLPVLVVLVSRPFIARRVNGHWRIDWTRDTAGRVTAIDGTPHNLWTFLTYPPVPYAELWRFTSLHRC